MNQHLFVIILRYIVDVKELDTCLKEHRQFLDQLYEREILIASGPQCPRSGGVMLARSSDRQTLIGIMQADPFYQNNCAEYQFYKFEVNKHAPEFTGVMKITAP